jgi:2-desacetyl-2-hydroxyethyl bacteriochlorophyllide A dehydrogenase
MRAAVYGGQAGPLRVQEAAEPAIGPDDVLVRVAACGVCTIEVGHVYLGLPTFKAPPVILGHEVSGTVAEVGERVNEVRVNDRVVLPLFFSCGTCSNCRAGRENVCTSMSVLGNHVDGGLAEYVRAPARDVFRLPPAISLEEACVITDAVSTPYHAVKNRARVRPGEVVAVFGCGGLGINAVQAASIAGGIVIAVDKQEAKLEVASGLGAFATVSAAAGDEVVPRLRRLAGGGADVAIEVSGDAGAVQQAAQCLRPGGRLCLIGIPAAPVPLNLAAAVFAEIEVVTALACPSGEYPRIIALVERGRFKLGPVVTARVGLGEVNAAIELASRSQGFKTIVIPS